MLSYGCFLYQCAVQGDTSCIWGSSTLQLLKNVQRRSSTGMQSGPTVDEINHRCTKLSYLTRMLSQHGFVTILLFCIQITTHGSMLVRGSTAIVNSSSVQLPLLTLDGVTLGQPHAHHSCFPDFVSNPIFRNSINVSPLQQNTYIHTYPGISRPKGGKFTVNRLIHQPSWDFSTNSSPKRRATAAKQVAYPLTFTSPRIALLFSTSS